MKKFDIRNMKGLSQKSARKLLDRYAAEYPSEYEEWLEHEVDPGGVGPSYKTIESFIRSNCEVDTLSDVTMAVGSMRQIVNHLIAQETLSFDLVCNRIDR
jgi:hypothetical protein